MGIVLLADRRFQRNRLLRNLDNLAHLLFGDAHLLGNLVRARVTAVFLHELAVDSDEFVDRFHHVHGNADGARLIRYGTGNRLTNPPGGVRGEFIALAVVELFHRFDEAEVAFLNQIEKQHAAPDVPLGNGNDEPEVRFRKLMLGVWVAVRHALGDFYFLGCG
ncbi:hypothetical protein SDC9_82588 [bioreactor metagenome]|uniref:Uncharacterized protein n=1 Tax=bioreactor metagenome TaxID=1076179 RepID=A0A644ZB94_9ZZZZ